MDGCHEKVVPGGGPMRWVDVTKKWVVGFAAWRRRRFLRRRRPGCFQPWALAPRDSLDRPDGHIIVGVYVDDIVVAFRGQKLFDLFSKAFQERFTSRFEGDLHWFLGIGIDQSDDFSVTANHEASITAMCEIFIPHNSVTRDCPPPDLFGQSSTK